MKGTHSPYEARRHLVTCADSWQDNFFQLWSGLVPPDSIGGPTGCPCCREENHSKACGWHSGQSQKTVVYVLRVVSLSLSLSSFALNGSQEVNGGKQRKAAEKGGFGSDARWSCACACTLAFTRAARRNACVCVCVRQRERRQATGQLGRTYPWGHPISQVSFGGKKWSSVMRSPGHAHATGQGVPVWLQDLRSL